MGIDSRAHKGIIEACLRMVMREHREGQADGGGNSEWPVPVEKWQNVVKFAAPNITALKVCPRMMPYPLSSPVLSCPLIYIYL